MSDHAYDYECNCSRCIEHRRGTGDKWTRVSTFEEVNRTRKMQEWLRVRVAYEFPENE